MPLRRGIYRSPILGQRDFQRVKATGTPKRGMTQCLLNDRRQDARQITRRAGLVRLDIPDFHPVGKASTRPSSAAGDTGVTGTKFEAPA